MDFIYIDKNSNLTSVIKVLNEAHGTIADDFGFTRESNPSNNAFIDADTLRNQMQSGIELFLMIVNDIPAGCIAIEKSKEDNNIYYIEKVSVIPAYRHRGSGSELIKFALNKIHERGGTQASISLIDSNHRLKDWYIKLGFNETGTKDYSHLPFRVCFMKKNL